MTTKLWPRFYWNLDPAIPAPDPEKLSTFVLRDAEPADCEAVQRVVESALRADISAGELLKTMTELCDDCFKDKNPLCAVASHGSRIIGASVLSAEPDAESHLLSGPCVLHEYHRRGIGTALVAYSLNMLRERGLSRVVAIAAPHTAVAKYLYPASGAEVRIPSNPATEAAGLAEAQ